MNVVTVCWHILQLLSERRSIAAHSEPLAPVESIKLGIESSKELSENDFAMAGNRTRVNCLEGSYAHHYTTIA